MDEGRAGGADTWAWQGTLRRRTPLLLSLTREGASLVDPYSGKDIQSWSFLNGLSATPNPDSSEDLTLTVKVNRSGVMKMMGRGEESKWVISSPDRAALLATLLFLRDITVDDEALHGPMPFMAHYALAGNLTPILFACACSHLFRRTRCLTSKSLSSAVTTCTL